MAAVTTRVTIGRRDATNKLQVIRVGRSIQELLEAVRTLLRGERVRDEVGHDHGFRVRALGPKK